MLLEFLNFLNSLCDIYFILKIVWIKVINLDMKSMVFKILFMIRLLFVKYIGMLRMKGIDKVFFFG